jgi:hypothetical protein
MRRLVSIAVFLTLFAFVPLAAQDDGPNVFSVSFFKVLPGKAPAYQAYLNVWAQYYEELVQRGRLVSFQFLRQGAGAGEYTNINLFEFLDWDAADDVSSEEANEVCQAVFGMTCQERDAAFFEEYGELPTIRTPVRTEMFGSAKP